MKINDIAKEIAKREGKKSQARMGDIKEMLGILSDIIAENKESFSISVISMLGSVVKENYYNENNQNVKELVKEKYSEIALLGARRSKKRNTKKRVEAQVMDRETESDYFYAFVMLLATGIYFGFYLAACSKLLEYVR